ncbi:hypothetical protein RB195_002072 [Necator americanus]|uniref:Uncharacterized protein n=1 Tax=Necator americanus TaxID=51031 RepID=A0ABR1DH92_NECAM
MSGCTWKQIDCLNLAHFAASSAKLLKRRPAAVAGRPRAWPAATRSSCVAVAKVRSGCRIKRLAPKSDDDDAEQLPPQCGRAFSRVIMLIRRGSNDVGVVKEPPFEHERRKLTAIYCYCSSSSSSSPDLVLVLVSSLAVSF